MISLQQILDWLAERTRQVSSQPLHARAFVSWLGSFGPDSLEQIAKLAMVPHGADRHTEHIAALGYVIHALRPENDMKRIFADDVAWLRQRQYFTNQKPPKFEVDGLALLGTALGISTADDARTHSADHKWLDNLLSKSLEQVRSDDWNGTLIRAAKAVSAKSTVTVELPADMRVALTTKGLSTDSLSDRETALAMITSSLHLHDSPTRNALHLLVLHRLVQDAASVRISGACIDDVSRLLNGAGASLRRWTYEAEPRTPRSAAARWDIENEYHVQNFLWAILAPVFPDLQDEENLPSLGQKHPRYDLGIPSLRLIVEAKFIREKGQRAHAKIIEEVAADASLYLRQGSAYDQILVFVWDDAAQTQEHAELRSGLVQIKGVHDAYIVPRPGQMVRSAIPGLGQRARSSRQRRPARQHRPARS